MNDELPGTFWGRDRTPMCAEASRDTGVRWGPQTSSGDTAFTHRLGRPHLCWTFSRRFFHPLRGPRHPGFGTLGQWQAARAPLCPPPASGCDLLPWTTLGSPRPTL